MKKITPLIKSIINFYKKLKTNNIKLLSMNQNQASYLAYKIFC